MDINFWRGTLIIASIAKSMEFGREEADKINTYGRCDRSFLWFLTWNEQWMNDVGVRWSSVNVRFLEPFSPPLCNLIVFLLVLTQSHLIYIMTHFNYSQSHVVFITMRN